MSSCLCTSAWRLGRVMAGFDRPRLFAAFAALITLTTVVSLAEAQISPGELHSSHAFLEGVDNCVRCHSPQGNQLPDKCLECHTLIAEQRRTGKGLHARTEYRECVLCHVEHHGRDYNLIYFEGGEESFDHRVTGFELEGKHAGLKCRQCHRPENIRSQSVVAAKNVSLERTWLGLERACASCHVDEHHSQFTQACGDCHAASSWRPAAGFDHSAARFVLRGRHVDIPCDKCHVFQTFVDPPSDSGFVRYRPVDHGQCSSCHRDPHAGRLGPNCTDCHDAAGWGQVRAESFDHDRTRYPVEGRHITVPCDKCHGARGSTGPLKFASCSDCHSDYHERAFARRDKRGACEECHTVQGFRPALFTISKHAATDFALSGAHLAIPCEKCHRTPEGYQKFTFTSVECLECHRDPHQGQVDRLVAVAGCRTCHTDRTWSDVYFDHSTTSFPLAGRHTTVACRSCHLREGPPQVTEVRFAPLSDRCESCHTDVHRGQFAGDETGTDCARCHTPPAWTQLHFDHTRDASFVLDGAHRAVPCNKCHPSVSDQTGRYVRYRGVTTQCAACHGNSAGGRESKS
ncbi:MAG: hypothetical protein C4532_04095 [Candidatus Abyssobacteria bacterium SURF_17]|uniref:Class III cytochrome C domain-containing protein n=1 Tax=Candidatus Abyssobacteria bacterium SURF_17 TaxID=2093361 RepID=A0A419F5N5_9BACT|nr:MAG: hypothetical protein C4532_04095 [Candidatus Abyssubacteria bacterium SURF_17]